MLWHWYPCGKEDEGVINYYSNPKVRNRGQEASSGSMRSSSVYMVANPNEVVNSFESLKGIESCTI